jgi:hypothetical protein
MRPQHNHFSGFFLYLYMVYSLAGLCMLLIPATLQAGNPTVSARSAAMTDRFSTERWSFEFRDVTLDQALFRISERTGAEFIYEPRLTAGKTVTRSFTEEELRGILDAVLLPTGLEARRIRTGIYVIRHTLRREISPLSRIGPGSERPQPALLMPQRVPATTTTMNVSIRDIIRQIVVP